MAIIMRAVRAENGTDFCAFVEDGLMAGDHMFSGKFHRTKTWVHIGRLTDLGMHRVFEPVGKLTYLGIHRVADDLWREDLQTGKSEDFVQQIVGKDAAAS